MNTQEFLDCTKDMLAGPSVLAQTDDAFRPRPHALCGDALKLSIQQGYGYNSDASSVEVYCIDGALPELQNFGDNPYFFVPIEVLDEFLKEHGGIKKVSDELPIVTLSTPRRSLGWG